jgi:hypothetical protein
MNVSAAVGFSVTWSDNVFTGFSVNVPAGQKWRIDAGYVAHTYQFEVWRSCSDTGAKRIGTGWADRYSHLVYHGYRVA